jgi:hypothetical protein
MTAEIAILNRSALALAADSAVTITIGKRSKVYDTAEKLFELSKKQPIALMIYNNVEYVGVPMDVLIRKFRACKDDDPDYVPYATIEQAADEFLKYLGEFDHELEEEEKYLYFSSFARFKRAFDAAAAEINELLFHGMATATMPSKNPSEILIEHLDTAIAEVKGYPLTGYLTSVTQTAFKDRFASVVERLAREVFRGIELDNTILGKAYRLAFFIMKSSEPSELLTGLVFGGFAANDMFPTLHYMEMDGIFFGKVKITSRNEVDIDRRRTRAEVVPFAQKEMVERFMYGLDTQLEEDVKSFVGSAIEQTLSAAGAGLDDDVKAATKRKISTTFNTTLEGLKEKSRLDLLDIVYFMSKKELADIAYALVELTSQKRRFSTDEQTVGGPIDVAILTKSEGLVWIERKHYFGPDKNQGYYSRVFGKAGGDK